MAVGTYALISLAEYKVWADISNSDIEENAIELYCSAGDATAATAAVSANVLTLIITGGANAGTVTKDLTAAANDTLGELASVIDGTAGWTANLIGTSAADSMDLKNVGATGCLGSANELTLIYYDNYSLEKLIDQATAWIEHSTRRKLKSRDYLFERYAGSGAKLFIKNYPITKIESIGIGSIECIKVQNTSSKYNAAVKVSATGVTLVEDGTEGTEITFASYATMTLLAAEINGTSGWTASTASATVGAYPSDRLYKHPNYYCLNEDVWLRCPYLPLNSYEVDWEAGIIDLGSAFYTTFMGIFICYTGGYVTIPEDFKLIACGMVKSLKSKGKTDGTMKSEKMGDYSYTHADKLSIISDDEEKVLKSYRRILI